MKFMQIAVPVLMIIINIIYVRRYFKVKDEVFNKRKVNGVLDNYKAILKQQIWLTSVGVALLIMAVFMEPSKISNMILIGLEIIYVIAVLILTISNSKKFNKFKETL